MYRVLILFYLSILYYSLNAQMVINCVNPKGVFHVDAKGDTDAGGNNSTDDVIITSNGNMGIGIISPTRKLDIKGDMRIVTGREQNRAVWTCINTNGLGDWQRLTLIQYIQGTVPTSNIPTIPVTNQNNYRYMQTYITLPQGSWQVYYTAIYNNNLNANYTTWWDLCTSPTTHVSVEVGRVLGYTTNIGNLSPVYCSYAVTVPPGAPKTYYLWSICGNATNSLGTPIITGNVTYNSGARIWAVPIQ